MSKIVGPVTIELRVHVALDDGRIGHTTCNLAAGTVPDRDAFMRMIGESLETIGPKGRILNDDEFFNSVVIAERYGKQRNSFAVPLDFSYDTAEVSREAREAYAAHKATIKPTKKRSNRDEEE